MTTELTFKKISLALIAFALTSQVYAAATDISSEPLNTYSAPSSTDVKPNVMFILDDSGSMDWDFMPDWACSAYSTRQPSCASTGQDPSSARSEHLFRNPGYNGVYYNPAVTYKPPVTIDSNGVINTTTYPSMTGMSAATGASTDAKPNWKAVKDDAYGIQGGTSTTDLPSSTTRPPYFFTTVTGEYCTSASLKTCIAATAPSTSHPFPAALRWCNDSTLSNCRAAFSSAYSWARSPSPRTATITVSGSSSTSVSGITVGSGMQIMAATASSTSNYWTLADRIAGQINDCTIALTGNCQVVGYAATASNGVVTITAPGVITAAPSVAKTGGMTINATSFAAGVMPGESLRTTITPSVTSYPYPGTAAKAPSRTDCAGTTCTYAEEMSNYANWWTYYRTRMQMMKTAASNAFATVDAPADLANKVSRFRFGYMSLNNNTGSDFLNLDEFKTSQKYSWYTKLLNARPNSGTPLRPALSDAGRLYAGKLNGTSYKGSTVVEPLQYSCQQNYSILSTDGFWNGNAGYKLNGSTSVGNQDAALPRPYYDGGAAQIQVRTSTLQSQSTSAQLQRSTNKLQKRTLSGGWGWWGGNWSNWADTSTCTAGSTTQCRYAGWSNYTNASACTNVPPSTASPYTTSTAVQCRTLNTTGSVSNASSCTASSTTNCSYTNWTSWSNASSCTAVAQSAGPVYTVATAKQCQSVSTGGTSNTLADVAAYYYGTDLRSPVEADGTGSCDGPIIAPATTPTNLCTDNVPASGRDVATTQHMTTFTLGLGAQGQMIYAPNDKKDYWNDKSGDFFDVANGTTPNATAGVCSWQNSGACNWPTPAADSNANIDDLWHAAINGHGAYFSAGDPTALANSLNATLATIINTPRPGTAAAAASSNPNVSASDNYVFSSSYKSIEWYGELIRQQIDENGVLSAPNWSAMKLLDCATTPWKAATSYVAGDVYFQGSRCYAVNAAYVSGAAFDNNSTGADMTNADVVNVDENAQTKVPATPLAARTIYTKSGTSLIPFQWGSLGTAGLQSYFSKPYISYVSDTVGLSQFCASGGTCLSATDQDSAAGEALVNFLRGDRSKENSFFRKRTHVLGDIVSSEARYVQAPLFNYADANYSAFKTANAQRAGVVYVGSNDGMLHAFDAGSGQERWAYIPGMVLPNLYRLADKNYATKHHFFVDNSPETGDICPLAPGAACSASQWRTILVGGLNRGGKGYYALDITNPASPTLLWEFTASNALGYSYGNPKITKLKNGTWVVLLSSGYNNTDGLGRLHVLNAATGEPISTIGSSGSISTGVGDASSPAGVARISAHAIAPMTDNTTLAAYGGDLFGNLWRFDINGDIGATGYDAQLLASFRDASNRAQPITVKLLEATINGKPVVFAGTGRYLGTTDVTDNSPQSFYAVMDKLDATTYPSPRAANSGFVKQTLVEGICPTGTSTSICSPNQVVRTISSNAVDWNTSRGWYFDFLSSGERSISDPSLGLGTLLFTTITPQRATVSACGSTDSSPTSSFVYALDYLTGSSVEGANGVAAMSLGSGLVTRPVMIKQSNGTVRALIRTSNGGGGAGGSDMGGTLIITPPIKPPSGSLTRRVSWRVLSSDK
ncbi:MAG: PilC/PilY family type IV pilus protein [Noviherbaspirillum sp.]